MLFNSFDFAVFLPIVFLVYWALKDFPLKWQNVVLLIASYLFYGWWDYRFLGLILISTLIDYGAGIAIHKYRAQRDKSRLFLVISLLSNLGLLFFFKYYNFFVQNVDDMMVVFGYHLNTSTLNILLPVGISFYTFQTMSYSIDVYKGKLEPNHDLVSFAVYVSFFPQLVAGPIERAVNLMPQFYSKRKFDYAEAVQGLRQILWGMFKKVVIADNCAVYANQIFDQYTDYNGSTLILGALFFTFQIYGDFSGYSDIAIGVARLFGFTLMRNFAFPYFSRDIAEFWRRWHISLSTWFKDYVYIPLGGSRGTVWLAVRNTFVIFLVSGFWHGANWTFIVWGGLNAVYFLPLLLSNKNRRHLGDIAPGGLLSGIRELPAILGTFCLTVFAWIFFRAESIGHAWGYIKGIFTQGLFSLPHFQGMTDAAYTVLYVCLMIVIEWQARNEEYALETIDTKLSKPLRYLGYYSLIALIFFSLGQEQEFIYFQF
ncbi:MBOAT family protein [Algoriphagus sp. H41]|uniref:MBOAT family protein n=1 Tax=Algoriphagus oliviformis TaxID=2811231 RepID=A0ABS3C714_9BACT|nr:MBOAT family protein [Algoriphagus oliviformis]MBN7812917.1 MBOAT family protein [Algoriphagus oliviformis]